MLIFIIIYTSDRVCTKKMFCPVLLVMVNYLMINSSQSETHLKCRGKFTLLELAILCLIPCIQEVVYLYMLIIVTCLILSVYKGNLTSNIIDFYVNVFSHLFIPYVSNELFFGTIRLLGLLAGACSLQSVVVRITASLS